MNFRLLIRKYVDEKRCKVAKEHIKDEDKKLLDIGHGNGFFLSQFKNIDSVGIDRKEGVNIRKDLFFQDNSFDYITMLAVLEHLEYPKDIIKECHRVLKDKGILIITVPLDNIIYTIYSHLFCTKQEIEDGVHIFKFNKKRLDKITDGFTLIKFKFFELGLNQLFIYEKK